MTCRLVVEGEFDAQLLQRILEANQARDFSISAAGGKSTAASFAMSILASRREPVALVLDADTSDQRAVEEQERIYYDLLRSISRTTPFKIFSAVPALEVVLFSDREILSKIAGVPVSDLHVRDAENRPRQVLNALLKKGGAQGNPILLLQHIDGEAGRRLAKHPLLKSIISFVKKPTSWTPEGLAA
jgi:hypothetical protein